MESAVDSDAHALLICEGYEEERETTSRTERVRGSATSPQQPTHPISWLMHCMPIRVTHANKRRDADVEATTTCWSVLRS